MKKEGEIYADAFKERFAGCICWYCRETPFSERHHVWGRSARLVPVEHNGKEHLVVAYKIIVAECAKCHRIAGRYLTDLRPLLTRLSLDKQPELTAGGQ